MPKPRVYEPETPGQQRNAFGKKREKLALKAVGGKPTPRSGAGRTKGDGRVTKTTIAEPDVTLHVEIKGTHADSFRVTRTIQEKLIHDAGHAREPVLVIDLAGRKPVRRWVCMSAATFTRLTGLGVDSFLPER